MKDRLLASNATVLLRTFVVSDRFPRDRHLDIGSPQFCAGLKFVEISQKSVAMADSHPSYIQARKGA